MVKLKVTSNDLNDFEFYDKSSIDDLMRLLEKQLAHKRQGDFFIRLFRWLFREEPQLSRHPRFVNCSHRLRAYIYGVEQLICSRKLGNYQLVGDKEPYDETFHTALEISDLIDTHASRELQTSASSFLAGILIAKIGVSNIC